MARRYHWLSASVQQLRQRAARRGLRRGGGADAEPRRARERRGPGGVRGAVTRAIRRSCSSALKRVPALTMPRRHAVLLADVNPAYLQKILLKTYERAPRISKRCSGWKVSAAGRCVRSRSSPRSSTARLPAHAIRRGSRSRTAARTDFPYPVDTGTYDKTVEVLRAAVTRAGIDRSERVQALKRLVRFGEERVRARLKAEEPADGIVPHSDSRRVPSLALAPPYFFSLAGLVVAGFTLRSGRVVFRLGHRHLSPALTFDSSATARRSPSTSRSSPTRP